MAMERLRVWTLDAAERAVKTAAQTALAVLTADEVLGIVDVDWAQMGSVVALATLVSVLTSVGSAGVGNGDTAAIDRAPTRLDVHDDGDTRDA